MHYAFIQRHDEISKHRYQCTAVVVHDCLTFIVDLAAFIGVQFGACLHHQLVKTICRRACFSQVLSVSAAPVAGSCCW